MQLRKQKTRTYAASSKVKSIGIQNKAMGANAKLAQAMGTAGKTMADMNRLMKPEQVMATVNAFGKESMKMDMTEEMSKFAISEKGYCCKWRNGYNVVFHFFFYF